MNTKAVTSLGLAFKAVALGMAALCIAITVLNFATLELYVILISLGLFSLTIAILIERPTHQPVTPGKIFGERSNQ